MRDFVTKISLTVLFVLSIIFSAYSAEKVTFKTNTPMIVAVGETFRVEFVLNAKPDDSSFTPPEFNGFDVLAGPAISQGFSTQIINGSMSKSVSYTITYVLVPQQAGTGVIGSAVIGVDDQSYKTKKLPIEIVDEGGENRGSSQQQQSNSGESGAQGRIGKDDILLRSTVSRTSVYKGQPLRVALKLYNRVNIAGIDALKAPSFNGFWAQELTTNGEPQRERETLNGKIYETIVIKEYLLYPQQSGALAIDPAQMTVVAQVVIPGSRNNDPFFGGGPEVYNVRRELVAPKVVINVKQLPQGAPASFSGAVGSFEMESTLPSESLAANSAATYSVKISGRGNLTFIQAPKLVLPTSFEQYNVKTTESIKSTSSGTYGYRNFEYPFIARAEGDYSIKEIEFTYFDPIKEQYRTLSSKAMTISISPDASASSGDTYTIKGQGLSKEDVKMLGQDIRFIKLGGANFVLQQESFIFRSSYYAILAFIFFCFVGAYIALRKRIKESKNGILLKGKRANKVAIQRFRIAKKFMVDQNRHAFFEEMLRGLWGYMSDKFNIPVANLTKESVREELHKRGLSSDESQHFIKIITRCDEAQYSPVESTHMDKIYSEGLNLISHIESVIKR